MDYEVMCETCGWYGYTDELKDGMCPCCGDEPVDYDEGEGEEE